LSRYLVTGGAGFIGSHIVEELVRRGDSVRVVDNLSTGHLENLTPVSNRIEFHQADIRDLESLRPLFSEVDYVVHLAALVSVERSMQDPAETTQINITGTLNVLIVARDAHVKRVVIASTCAAYGDDPHLPHVESISPQPLSPYALSKVAGEYYGQIFSREFGLDVVSLRFFNVFGPRQDPRSAYTGVLSIFIAAYLRGAVPTIFGDGEQSRDFTYVANIANAVLLACQSSQAAGKIVNVGTGKSCSLNQIIAVLNGILGVSVTPKYAPARKGDVRHSRAEIALARATLGYEPVVKFEDGLRRTIDWVRTAAL
jgi:nucleoside-diphosphate-sugar epimerase